MPLTERERGLILQMRGYGNRQRSAREVQQIFNAEYRNGLPGISAATVLKTV